MFISRGIYATACTRHINCENTVLYRNHYSSIPNIYRNSYTLLYCIMFRILTDSYRVNKREYGLHVFMESLHNDIQESYSKNIQKNFVLYSTVFCPNTEEYVAKKTRIHDGFMYWYIKYKNLPLRDVKELAYIINFCPKLAVFLTHTDFLSNGLKNKH